MEFTWISDLDGPPPAAPHRGTLASARRRLGDGPVRWICATAQAMTEYIIGRIPENEAAPMPSEAVCQTAGMVLAACLRAMAGEPGGSPAVPQEGADLVRDCVCRGIPLHRVLRGVRLGHEFAYRALRDAAPNEAMPHITEFLFDQTDWLSGALAEIYVAERDRWEASGEAARYQVIEAIISGDERGAAGAEGILGYASNRHHVAVVLWREDRRRADACPAQVTAPLLAACGGDDLVHVAGRGGAIWGWIGFSARPDSVSWPQHLPSGWRAAVGPPAYGMAGMRRTHLGARQASRIAATLPGLPAVCDFATIRTVCLLTRDTEHARWYVQETLGPLAAAEDAWTEQLRDTLRCYLAHDRSLKTAADRLGIARNTVAYRVSRVQELLAADADPLAVRLALEMMRFPAALESAAAGQQASVRQMYVKAGLVR